MSSRNELWDLIEQITLQIDDIIAQGSDTSNTLQEMENKLKMLTTVHQACIDKEKYMRCKQLALMRERNLYLEKCKKIQKIGTDRDWTDTNKFLPQVLKVLCANSQEDETID